MTHDRARWLRLSRLFDEAIDLPPGQREAFVADRCRDDASLRAELQRMLDADATAHGIDAGAAAAATVHDGDAEALAAVGERLGPWRLQAVLGRGGMGSVYEAVREDGDVRQRAAIKRLQRRWDGSAQAQRFLQERRILAQLSHANIPALVDQGLDADGRPWFALEYVDGLPLVAWADARALPLRERVVLFLQVCAAVRHAHERFVVHRDLKPANILVDAEGRARVLDFGVAKLLREDDGATRTGAFAGFTPEYAAPEQVSGGAITAATDVYALGVVLYQLLSGVLPYRFGPADLRDAAEAITTRTPGRLDRALAQGEPDDVQVRMRQRATTPGAYRRFVRGDLSRIVQTALAKEPARRYASVQALADDLRRFLDGRPVSVAGDTPGYRLRKFVLRNRWGVAMASLAVVALLAGTLFSLHRAERERAQRQRAESVLAFMRSLFTEDVVTDGRQANQITAVDMLRYAAAQADRAFAGDPLGKAAMLNAVAGLYASMGEGDAAVAQAERAVRASLPLREGEPAFYLESVDALADAYMAAGDHAQVVAVVDRALPFFRRHADPVDYVAGMLRRRGWSRGQLGDPAGAEADLREAVSIFERAGAPPSKQFAATYNHLAQVVSDRGDPRAALALLDKSDAIERRAPDSPPADRLISGTIRAREHFRLAEYARAVELLEAAIPGLERLTRPDYPQLLVARSLLAQAYAAQGRYALALEASHGDEARAGADTERAMVARMNRAKLLTYDGRAVEAVPLAQSGVAWFLKRYPEPTLLRGRAQWILGEALLRADRCNEATRWLRAALSDERAQAGDTPTANAGEALDSLGRCQLIAGDLQAARRTLDEAARVMRGALGDDNPRSLRTQAHAAWARQLAAPGEAHARALRDALPRFVEAAGSEHASARREAARIRQSALRGTRAPDARGLNSLS